MESSHKISYFIDHVRKSLAAKLIFSIAALILIGGGFSWYLLISSVRENLVREARKYSHVDHRSITGQIEHWAKIGKCAEDNPDLTYSLIKEILIGLEELEQGERSEYKFG